MTYDLKYQFGVVEQCPWVLIILLIDLGNRFHNVTVYSSLVHKVLHISKKNQVGRLVNYNELYISLCGSSQNVPEFQMLHPRVVRVGEEISPSLGWIHRRGCILHCSLYPS